MNSIKIEELSERNSSKELIAIKNKLGDISVELDDIKASLSIYAGMFLENDVHYQNSVIGEALNGFAMYLERISYDICNMAES